MNSSSSRRIVLILGLLATLFTCPPIAIVFLVAIFRNGAPVLVAKQWTVDLAPGPNGSYAHIEGRKAGPIAYLLNLFDLDYTMSWVVTGKGLEQKLDSLFEKSSSFVPYQSVSQISTGFIYPIHEALLVFFVGNAVAGILMTLYTSVIFGGAANSVGVVGIKLVVSVLFAGALAFAYLYIQRRVVVEVTQHSGRSTGFAMKRSVIEGREIDLAKAEELRDLIRFLAVEALPSAASNPVSTGPGMPPSRPAGPQRPMPPAPPRPPTPGPPVAPVPPGPSYDPAPVYSPAPPAPAPAYLPAYASPVDPPGPPSPYSPPPPTRRR